ncbi:MAG: flavodoxin-dependent (E)-4-hydroxy-3-methylbut-2-enyl-diphosphate synthase, partial [Calditrichaeota bacterium]
IDATVEQIRELAVAGCEIVRCAVPNEKAAEALKEIIGQVQIPVVADIHFNYRLALISLESGVHKIRINPGNIGDRRRAETVLSACREHGVPIRIGVNAGSLEPHILQKYRHSCPEAMVESALHHIHICEDNKFQDIVISLKSSDVNMMIAAYRQLAERVEYPLHLGVTEAGPVWSGTIKSTVGIGTLLAEGIGDTIRVSLTGNPHEEVRVGREILKSLGLLKKGVTIISCPTCGRLDTPELADIVVALEKRIENIDKNLTVAVMGCAVNGPGEAREADIGVACGRGEALLFRKGRVLGKIHSNQIVDRLYQEIVNFR